MTIKRIHQNINNSISNFSTTPLKNTVIKAVGVFSILFGLAVIAGTVFLLYATALRMDMPSWKNTDWVAIIPFGIITILALVFVTAISGPSIVYGKRMLQAKLTDPKNPVASEGEL